MKSLLKTLLLIGIGFLLGTAWFRLGPSFAPAHQQQRGLAAGTSDLPALLAPFDGRIGRTWRDSQPSYPQPVRAPAGAPNVLVVLTDDVGFAASGTFGGPVPTPNLDALAAGGLTYTRFHTTAMCSPTRAAMLTGRNAHMVGNGMITNLATGYPGYDGEIPKSAASIARILKGHGYNTAFFGKHHNLPDHQSSAAGPFDLWPSGLGFEYFFGFITGDTDQYRPRLYRDNQPVEADPGDHRLLDEVLADDLIHWLHNQQAAAPDKPFLVWYSPGTAHAPLQAPPEWIARFKGRFDQGWDRLRKEIFQRQLEKGLVPPGTVLTARPAALPAWRDLEPERQQVDERFMEVFAAVLAYQDQQIGRVLDELRRMGEFDNTLILFVQGDNGASAEGAVAGSLNEIGHIANGIEEPLDYLQARLPEIGGPRTYPAYPAGWAWALDTPFQWTKTIASHLGGIRNPLVVSWPKGIRAHGEIRTQFHHVIDILPTVLEAAGIEAPEVVDGVRQQRIDGISMVYSFDAPDTPGRRQTQYFELLGNRAIYHDGWMANTTPRAPPWSWDDPGGDPDTDYDWELYNLDEDYSQARNLAAEEPARLAELKSLFEAEAERNNVLPLDDRRSPARVAGRYLAHWGERDEYVYWGADVSVPFAVAPPLFARDFTILADVSAPAGASGVLIGYGSRFGGWSFYLEQGRPVACHVFSQRPGETYVVASPSALPAGDVELEFHFAYDGGGLGKGGTMEIRAGGELLASGRIERTVTVVAGLGETFDIGRDTGVPVLDEPAARQPWPGRIRRVEVRPGPLGLLPF